MDLYISTPMAFVLVQHLAPDHKSILSELIGRYTRMNVYEVEDGMLADQLGGEFSIASDEGTTSVLTFEV